MPCCAFAAFLFSQLVIGCAAVRRLVLGARAETRLQSNPPVEWRLLESGGATTASGIRPPLRRARRVSVSIVALAAVIELALLLGTIYSVRTHLGHAHHETVGATSSH